MKDNRCMTPSCVETARCAGLCSACYSYAYRWGQLGVSRSMKHRSKLAMRIERIDNMSPRNVVQFRRKAR